MLKLSSADSFASLYRFPLRDLHSGSLASLCFPFSARLTLPIHDDGIIPGSRPRKRPLIIDRRGVEMQQTPALEKRYWSLPIFLEGGIVSRSLGVFRCHQLQFFSGQQFDDFPNYEFPSPGHLRLPRLITGGYPLMAV